jgi:hypothetical protein
MSGERKSECGLGLGHYDGKTAIATSCGARLNDKLDFNAGVSALPGGSESYLIGNLPAFSFRAGVTWKFGGPSASPSTRKVSAAKADFRNLRQVSKLKKNMISVIERADKADERVKNLEFEVALLLQEVSQIEELKEMVSRLNTLIIVDGAISRTASLRD